MLIKNNFETFIPTRFLSTSMEFMKMKVRHVLIIDDEEDIREVVEVTLQTMTGWQVVTAASGIEGLEIAQTLQPDAILLDMMMPDLDGIATLSILRATPETQHIPVILITAKEKNVDRSRLTELGVTAIIAKPFNPMNLAKQIASDLGWNDI
jgi:CheY-like chemotaxis protein